MVAILGSPAGLAGAAQPASSPSRTAPPPAIPTVLQNIEATYRAPEFEMWFTRTYLVKAYNLPSTSQGTLTFAGPDKASWRQPNGDYLVINGQTMGSYDAATRSYVLQSAKTSAYLSALAFMAGPGALAAQCNLTIYPGSQLQYPNGYVLLCDPKVPSPAFTKLLYYVDAASSEVRRVLILDAQGNRDRFDLDQLQVHTVVSPQLFSLTPPPGVVVTGWPGNAPAAPTSSGASPLTPKVPGP